MPPLLKKNSIQTKRLPIQGRVVTIDIRLSGGYAVEINNTNNATYIYIYVYRLNEIYNL